VANFKTHFGVGATSSAILSGVLLSMEVLTPMEATVAFGIGTFGSLLPDIDADNSKSIEIAFTIISLLITILFVFAKTAEYSIIELLVMSGAIFWTVRFGFIGIFRKISRHRGMFHSVPLGLIFGVGTAILMHNFFGLNSLVSWIYGIMMSFGYIVHLILDELYSVDLGNRRVKKSAGTALKFFTPYQIQNLLIYITLGLLLLISPDFSLVKETLFSYDAWLNFKYSLFPQDGKWFFH
jgi:hypothetical protein